MQILGFNACIRVYVDVSVGMGCEVREVSRKLYKEMSKKEEGKGDRIHEQQGGYCGQKATEKPEGRGRREGRRADPDNCVFLRP